MEEGKMNNEVDRLKNSLSHEMNAVLAGEWYAIEEYTYDHLYELNMIRVDSRYELKKNIMELAGRAYNV